MTHAQAEVLGLLWTTHRRTIEQAFAAPGPFSPIIAAIRALRAKNLDLAIAKRLVAYHAESLDGRLGRSHYAGWTRTGG